MSSDRSFLFFLGAQEGHILVLEVGSQLLFRNGLLFLFLGGFNILGIFSFEDGDCISSISFELSLLRGLYDGIFGWNGLRYNFFGEMG